MNDEIKKSIAEKIVIGTIAIVVSTFVLHGYNVHLKEFEAAQIQLHSLSNVAISSRDNILKAISELRSDAYGHFQNYPTYKPEQLQVVVNRLVGTIRANSGLLAPRFGKAATEASNIADKLLNKIVIGPNGFSPDANDIKNIDREVVADEVTFLKNFDDALAQVLSDEFDGAYKKFFHWYADPTVLGLLLISFCTILLLIVLRSDAARPAPSAPIRHFRNSRPLDRRGRFIPG